MENSLSFVDTEIEYFSRSEKHSEDLYGETMGKFAKEAKEEYYTLKVLFSGAKMSVFSIIFRTQSQRWRDFTLICQSTLCLTRPNIR